MFWKKIMAGVLSLVVVSMTTACHNQAFTSVDSSVHHAMYKLLN